MLIIPNLLTCSEVPALCRRRRRVCHFCDEIGCGCLRNAIYQDADQWDAYQSVETEAETEEEAFTAMEPVLLLLLIQMDTGKVRLQQLAHQTSGTKVGLQEDDQVPPWEEEASAKYDGCRAESHSLIESVETGGREDETANIRYIRQGEDGHGNSGFAGEADSKHGTGLGSTSGMRAAVSELVLLQIGIIHIPQGVGSFVLVLFYICLVDPAQRVHEHVIEGRGDVTHQCHEKQRCLQNMVGQQLEEIDYALVP